MTSSGIVQKLWNYCNILREDGLSYRGVNTWLKGARFDIFAILNACPAARVFTSMEYPCTSCSAHHREPCFFGEEDDRLDLCNVLLFQP